MLEYELERQFTLEISVALTGRDGRPHKGTFHATFRSVEMSEARKIVRDGDEMVLERALVSLGDDLVLRDSTGQKIEDPELRRTAVLEQPKLASSLAAAYWAEESGKKP